MANQRRVFGQTWDRLTQNAVAKAELPPSSKDSPAYLDFRQWWAEFRAQPVSCKFADHVGSFTRAGAILRERSAADKHEAAEERAAIQGEV